MGGTRVEAEGAGGCQLGGLQRSAAVPALPNSLLLHRPTQQHFARCLCRLLHSPAAPAQRAQHSLCTVQAWLWRVEGQDLFFERGLPLRFKVQSLRFHDPPTLAEQQEQVGSRRGPQAA